MTRIIERRQEGKARHGAWRARQQSAQTVRSRTHHIFFMLFTFLNLFEHFEVCLGLRLARAEGRNPRTSGITWAPP